MAKNIIATRSHRIHAARSGQLANNILAWKGGRPYIDARLHRAPNEADISWDGDDKGDLPGRQGRAYLVNDAGRIVDKINQYLFGGDTEREGMDEAWGQDVTTTGLSVRQFWEKVSEQFTSGQWVWLQVDRGAPEVDPETSQPLPRSKAQREAAGDRIYWNIWSSTEVVDWCFDGQGRLRWLLSADSQYNNADPFVEAKTTAIRTLWQADAAGCKWTRYQIDNSANDLVILAQGVLSTQQVPFVLLGVPSADPWWFDDVEMIQGAAMNLESLHYENLVKTVYPQLIIPEGMVESLEQKLVERYGHDKGETIVELVKELIRGLDRPFIESAEEQGITRYLQPSAQDLKAIPEHVTKLRQQLFDMVGMALFNRESRQVQSAEAKQFDHLDIEATLTNRSMLLQESEAKLVALSKELDSDFREYTAIWPQEFSVPTTSEDIEGLTQLANFAELPPTMVKRLLKTAMKLLDELEHIPPEEQQVIMTEIDAMAAAASASQGHGGEG